jgi:hypothetical protein
MEMLAKVRLRSQYVFNVHPGLLQQGFQEIEKLKGLLAALVDLRTTLRHFHDKMFEALVEFERGTRYRRSRGRASHLLDSCLTSPPV